MAFPKPHEVKRGDWVRILSPAGDEIGRIVEYRGPLGPKGVPVYRVRLRKRPRRVYTEVREDQLEMIPDPRPGRAGPPPA
jgi:hypothetical protein